LFAAAHANFAYSSNHHFNHPLSQLIQQAPSIYSVMTNLAFAPPPKSPVNGELSTTLTINIDL
jgi:hypothetical protein